jgi:hypothetical protein
MYPLLRSLDTSAMVAMAVREAAFLEVVLLF